MLQVIVDRVRIDADMRTRLTDSIETSYREGGGAAFAIVARRGRRSPADRLLRAIRVPVLRYRLRNAAAAALLVQQSVRRLSDLPRLRQHHRARHGSRRAGSDEIDQPGGDRAVEQAALPLAARRAEASGAQDGSLRLDVPVGIADRRRAAIRRRRTATITTGIRGFFRWLERKKYKVHVRVFLSRYRGYLTCPDCGGARLRREARYVRVGGKTIDQVSALTVQDAQAFFADARRSPRRMRRSRTR